MSSDWSALLEARYSTRTPLNLAPRHQGWLLSCVVKLRKIDCDRKECRIQSMRSFALGKLRLTARSRWKLAQRKIDHTEEEDRQSGCSDAARRRLIIFVPARERVQSG